MKIAYIVHSVNPEEVTTTVQFEGQDILAKVPCATAELLADGFGHVFRFIHPADVAEALAWQRGQTITVTAEAVPLAPAPQDPAPSAVQTSDQVSLTTQDVGSLTDVLGAGQVQQQPA